MHADYAHYLLNFLMDAPAWVNRRVHTIELIDDTSVAHRVSTDMQIDVTDVGAEYVQLLREEMLPTPLVPLGLLAKAPLNRFDLRDANGGAMSLLTQRQTTPYVVAMLIAAARTLGQDAEPVRAELRKIVDAPKGTSLTALSEFRTNATNAAEHALKSALLADPAFNYLLTTLAEKFVALAVCTLSQCEGRRVIKYSYRTKIPWHGGFRVLRSMGWVPVTLHIPLTLVRLSSSFHVEVEAPEHLDISLARISGRIGDAPWEPEQQQFGPRRLAHLFAQEHRFYDSSEYSLVVKLVNQRRGLVRSSLVTTTFVAFVLTVFAIWQARSLPSAGPSAAGLLLFIPGLAAAYTTRASEHVLASRLCLGLRSVVLASGFLAFCAALLIYMDPSWRAWGVGATAAGALVAWVLTVATYAINTRTEPEE